MGHCAQLLSTCSQQDRKMSHDRLGFYQVVQVPGSLDRRANTSPRGVSSDRAGCGVCFLHICYDHWVHTLHQNVES